MKIRLMVFVLAFLITTVAVWAAPLPDTESIPQELQQWESWVLYGKEDRFCPTSYDSGDQYRCIWPSRLTLNLDQKGGQFTQGWMVFKKGRVPLPGGPDMWPQGVTVDGEAAPVLGKMNSPSVFVTKGRHSVDGRFVWDRMPEMIQVPEASGLVTLLINNKPVDFPLLDGQGRLWLQKREEIQTREERVGVRIYRLLNDTIPMQVTNLLKINVSGYAREIKINGILLDGVIPMSIKSPLPARIGSNGELMVQARPGRWEIRVLTRFPGSIHKIGPVEPAYGQEIWTFQSQNHLRMVKIRGVPAIDPNQTDMPAQWKTFPTFMVKAGNDIIFDEIRRGDPEPAPDQLHLKRTWWLDFNGKGLTVQDRIQGTMSRQWYLAMNRPGILGRVSIDGTDQLITSQGKDKKPGVELRRGHINLVAESRCESSTKLIPAVGWDHDFQSVSGFLNLPAGWRLLTASGVDVMPGTWFERWTLLDLFLVLIISLAIFKLWNWRWGMLALIAVALTYHEPGSPRLVWLHLLAASALLRFLPQGWARKLVTLWRLGSIVVLLVLAIPFIVQQVRWGVYPQLEQHRSMHWRGTGTFLSGQAVQDAETRSRKSVLDKSKLLATAKPYDLSEGVQRKLGYSRKQAVLIQDPNALIQTGPGLPTWKWRSFAMKWNGPVDRTQQIRFCLLSPPVNLILSFVRVFLLALLICGLMELRKWKIPKEKFTFTAAVLCILLFSMPARAETKEMGFPCAELLQQLQERLLKKPDCLPNCADIPKMALTASSDSLRILLHVHAAIETAVPLPGASKLWQPKQVLLDSEPAQGLARDNDGSLWIFVPQGLHRVTLMGRLPHDNTFQIPLPLKPRRVTLDAKGWDVQGVDENGLAQSSIKLIRQGKREIKFPENAAMTLPPFLHVERVLSLGLEWQVYTTVRRITPPGVPIVISVPLIAGESVTTAQIRTEKGSALVHMEPKTQEVGWNSVLKQNTVIRLNAPQSVSWTETWVLDASPIWHCELSGIPIIHHKDHAGHWRPQWEPWPGESVKINVSRPKAIPGQSVTTEDAKLTYTPGRRFNKASLFLKMRSSQGGQNKIVLPDGARLQRVKISGKEQPIKARGNEVIIPIRPGSQTITVEWHQSAGSALLTRAPHVGIGQKAVNANVIFEMPRNRWILMTKGPRMGPAVLFWSYLVVVILAALGLARVPWTPLKTHHWLLLGLGLTQVHPLVAIMIVGWFIALGLRCVHPAPGGWFYFDMIQIILAAWTIAALIGLYISIQKGLLGIPNMQISGNGSSDFFFRWTQDRIGDTMPQPWVLSLPLFVYRILMLIWALWLAYFLLKWLRWGWSCFVQGGIWRKVVVRIRKQKDKAQPSDTEASKTTP
jgi:hypothetical protein